MQNAHFEIERVSAYTFRCRRLAKFRRGCIFFLATRRHRVSPFGVAGGHEGIQDVDNLGWKLHGVLTRSAVRWVVAAAARAGTPA